MKKTYLQIILFACITAALSAYPSYLSAPVVAGNTPNIKIDFNSIVSVSSRQNKTNIILGESESQKRERLEKEAVAKRQESTQKSRNVAISYSTDLESLRAIYREAASKHGIDWRLIEAVHQVETGKSALCKKSYAGATGPMQFMPSTFRAYAESGANICDLRDSIFAAANLLARSGASDGNIDKALFNYNHSWSYVKKVKGVMDSI